MNILLVTDTYLPYITGVSVSTDNIARFMVSRGHKVTLVCPKPLVKGRVMPLKNLVEVTTPSLPFTVANKNPIGILPIAKSVIKSLIKKNEYDIVHIQEPAPTGFAALLVAQKFNLPIIGSFHFIPQQTDRNLFGGRVEHIFTPLLNKYINFVYNKYDAVMTVSNFFADYLRAQNVKKEIHVISNGVDTSIFKPGKRNPEIRKRLGIPDKNTVFMFLGRLDGDKNVETLIRAMKYTKKNITLLVIGRGVRRQRMQIMAKLRRVSKKIVWVNFISNAEMPDYYRAVDAFAIMSPFEGQSIVTLQAAATGLPVIAANASALPELVHDGANGYLVDTYNSKGVAEKMNLLASDTDLRKKLGEESRRISLKHDRTKVLGKLEDLYKKVISAKI